MEHDGFLLSTLDRWIFGHDDVGDIRSSKCIAWLKNEIGRRHDTKATAPGGGGVAAATAAAVGGSSATMATDSTDLIESYSTLGQDVYLVTADGSVNCSATPNEQEAMVAHLLYCETVAGLHILARGGHLVLKAFTFFEECSVHLLQLLAACFEELHVTKPGTSTQSNAEVYVVAKCFKGLSAEVLGVLNSFVDIPESAASPVPAAAEGKDVSSAAVASGGGCAGGSGGVGGVGAVQLTPTPFLAAVQQCSDYFSKQMRDAIERNLATDGKLSHQDKAMLNEIKARVSAHFLSTTGLAAIPDRARVVPPAKLVERGLNTSSQVSARHDLAKSNPAWTAGTLLQRQNTTTEKKLSGQSDATFRGGGGSGGGGRVNGNGGAVAATSSCVSIIAASTGGVASAEEDALHNHGTNSNNGFLEPAPKKLRVEGKCGVSRAVGIRIASEAALPAISHPVNKKAGTLASTSGGASASVKLGAASAVSSWNQKVAPGHGYSKAEIDAWRAQRRKNYPVSQSQDTNVSTASMPATKPEPPTLTSSDGPKTTQVSHQPLPHLAAGKPASLAGTATLAQSTHQPLQQQPQQPQQHQSKAQSSGGYGAFAMKQMLKMGYVKGQGLGRVPGGGITEPIHVTAPEMNDRAGIGFNEPSVDTLTTSIPGAPWFETTDGSGSLSHMCRSKAANVAVARIGSMPKSSSDKLVNDTLKAAVGSGHLQLPDATGWRVTTGKPLAVVSMTKFGLRARMQALHAHRKSVKADEAAVAAIISKRLRLASDAVLSAVASGDYAGPACQCSDVTGDFLKMANLDSLFSIFGGETAGAAEAPPFAYVAMGYSTFGASEYIAWKHGTAAVGTICTVPRPPVPSSASLSGVGATANASAGSKLQGDATQSWQGRAADSTCTAFLNKSSAAAKASMESLVAASIAEKRFANAIFCDLEPAASFASLNAVPMMLGTEIVSPAQKGLSLRQLFSSCRLLRSSADSSRSMTRLVNVPGEGGAGGAGAGARGAGAQAGGRGGTLVVRIGDMLTRWSVGLFYILFRSFASVRIVKPFTTSPLDPERWLVCTDFRGLSASLGAHMCAAEQRCAAGENVLAIVPMQLLLEPGFMTFVTRANDRLATREISAIKAVLAAEGAGIPASAAGDGEFVKLGRAALAKLNML